LNSLINYLKKKSDTFIVQAGFSHEIDKESSFKGKLLNTGLANFAYQVKVKPELNATVSLELSVKEISNIGKLGFELSYEPQD